MKALLVGLRLVQPGKRLLTRLRKSPQKPVYIGPKLEVIRVGNAHFQDKTLNSGRNGIPELHQSLDRPTFEVIKDFVRRINCGVAISVDSLGAPTFFEIPG